jgi:hypothetical protein
VKPLSMPRILHPLFSVLVAISTACADDPQMLTVVDAKTGKPLEGAKVGLHLRHINPYLQTKVTGKDGVVDLSKYGHLIWGINVSKRGYRSQDVELPPKWPVKIVLKKKGAL